MVSNNFIEIDIVHNFVAKVYNYEMFTFSVMFSVMFTIGIYFFQFGKCNVSSEIREIGGIIVGVVAVIMLIMFIDADTEVEKEGFSIIFVKVHDVITY